MTNPGGDEELSPTDEFARWVIRIVLAVNQGGASGYSNTDLLTSIGAVWVSRRLLANEGDEPERIQALDGALELLAAEVEARGILAESPLHDFPDDDPRG
jgi:hypothetical protein